MERVIIARKLGEVINEIEAATNAGENIIKISDEIYIISSRYYINVSNGKVTNAEGEEVIDFLSSLGGYFHSMKKTLQLCMEEETTSIRLEKIQDLKNQLKELKQKAKKLEFLDAIAKITGTDLVGLISIINKNYQDEFDTLIKKVEEFLYKRPIPSRIVEEVECVIINFQYC